MVINFMIQIARWAAYPSSQVLLRVCQEPFRPLQLMKLVSGFGL